MILITLHKNVDQDKMKSNTLKINHCSHQSERVIVVQRQLSNFSEQVNIQ
jgi:hypothetical protein